MCASHFCPNMKTIKHMSLHFYPLPLLFRSIAHRFVAFNTALSTLLWNVPTRHKQMTKHMLIVPYVVPSVFLFNFAIIMIVTCKTTTLYMCLFPSSQIMHSSMEQQLLPQVQYANECWIKRSDFMCASVYTAVCYIYSCYNDILK